MCFPNGRGFLLFVLASFWASAAAAVEVAGVTLDDQVQVGGAPPCLKRRWGSIPSFSLRFMWVRFT